MNLLIKFLTDLAVIVLGLCTFSGGICLLAALFVEESPLEHQRSLATVQRAFWVAILPAAWLAAMYLR